jgi:hypothetical protein
VLGFGTRHIEAVVNRVVKFGGERNRSWRQDRSADQQIEALRQDVGNF